MKKKKAEEKEQDDETGCQECGDNAEALYDDPRDPPLDDYFCLCRECCIAAYDQAISDKEDELKSLEEEKKQLEKEAIK